jgi:hypothetical protein
MDMAGLDRLLRVNALKDNGWIESEDGRLTPPDRLWRDKPKNFHVYDAIELHGYLGDPAKMTDELKDYCGVEGDK